MCVRFGKRSNLHLPYLRHRFSITYIYLSISDLIQYYLLKETKNKEVVVSQVDQTKNAFENKFAHNEEMLFKVNNRRNKLLALWAADILGKDLDEANNYVREVIKVSFVKGGDDEVFGKLVTDLGDQVPNEAIRDKMAQLMLVAKDEVVVTVANTPENANSVFTDESMLHLVRKTDASLGLNPATRKSKLVENLKRHNRSWT